MKFLVKKRPDTHCKTESTKKKNSTSKDLVAGLYITEISKDLSQTNQFRE